MAQESPYPDHSLLSVISLKMEIFAGFHVPVACDSIPEHRIIVYGYPLVRECGLDGIGILSPLHAEIK